MPIIDIVHQQMITAKALHNANKQANVPTHDVLDMTAIIAASRIAAGLDAFDSKKVRAAKTCLNFNRQGCC